VTSEKVARYWPASHISVARDFAVIRSGIPASCPFGLLKRFTRENAKQPLIPSHTQTILNERVRAYWTQFTFVIPLDAQRFTDAGITNARGRAKCASVKAGLRG